jgi:outer membrane protein TolC
LNRISVTWMAAAILLIGTGCSVDQSREVQTYRKVLDAGQVQLPEAFSAGAPLTLEEALALANANNEQLARAGEDYLQALIDKDRAFARFLPTIRFTPSYMRQEESSLGGGNPLIDKFLRTETTDAPLEGTLHLAPLQDVPALKAAASSAEQRRALLLDRRAILLLDVAQTYYQVVRSEKQVGVLEHSVLIQQQRVRDMEVQRRVGVARPVDVAQTAAQLAATRNSLIQARNDVRNGRAMLAQLMGVASVEGPLAGGFEIPTENRSMDDLLKLAEMHRRDLQAARIQVTTAARRLEAAWGGYFPSVSLNLSRYLYRESFPDDVEWTGLIQANLPIFSAGLVHADVRTAYSRLRQARLAESGLRRTVLRQLRTAGQDLDADRLQIEQLGIRLAAAREAMRQADAAYMAGLGTNLERLVAQDQLLSAELALTEEQVKHVVDYLRLLRATGLLDTALTPLPRDHSGDALKRDAGPAPPNHAPDLPLKPEPASPGSPAQP